MYLWSPSGGIRLTSGAQLLAPVVQEPLLGRASWLMTLHGPSGVSATATWMLYPLPLVANAYHFPPSDGHALIIMLDNLVSHTRKEPDSLVPTKGQGSHKSDH